MNEIENFYKVRQDGKLIVESMNIEQIFALGEISKVIKVCWTCASNKKTASLQSTHGVFAMPVTGRQFIAALIYNEQDAQPPTKLVVVNPDGSVRFTLSTTQKIDGKSFQGFFSGIDNAQEPKEGVFGAVFQAEHPTHSADFLLDIDAVTGKVLRCHWTR